LKALSLIEVLSAAHLSRFVNHSIYQQRGGVFIVSPPGSLKSSLIRSALNGFPDALQLADLNINTLTMLKSSFIDGKYSTMAFGEFEKLYQRNPATAANIEGHLKAMVEEGFGKSSFEDQRMVMTESRVLVIAGITPSCYSRLHSKWMENGFMRRFLWCSYTLNDPNAITEAIHKWKPLTFGRVVKEMPANENIPYNVTTKESTKIRDLLKYQPSLETPYTLAKKIFCVLKWRHSAIKAMSIFEDFSESLGNNGAKLFL
jgi:hypothetical protein